MKWLIFVGENIGHFFVFVVCIDIGFLVGEEYLKNDILVSLFRTS